MDYKKKKSIQNKNAEKDKIKGQKGGQTKKSGDLENLDEEKEEIVTDMEG